MGNTWWLAPGMALAAVSALLCPASAAEEPLKPYQVGDAVDDFTLPDVEGKPVKLSDFKGKVVFLELFASWCPHCVTEVPRVKSDVWDKYRERGLQVLGVGVRARKDPAKEAKGHVERHKVTYPVLVNADNSLYRRFGGRSVPTHVLIGRDGKLLYTAPGKSLDKMIKVLEEALDAAQ